MANFFECSNGNLVDLESVDAVEFDFKNDFTLFLLKSGKTIIGGGAGNGAFKHEKARFLAHCKGEE